MRNGSRARIGGVVLEVRGGRAVVLADGRFLRLRAVEGWQPGQEVWLRLPRDQGGRPWRRALAAAAAAAGTIAVVLTGSAVAAALPVAVVSVDLSPGVQLTVNHWARVVQEAAPGPAGARLLARVGPLRDLPVQEAVARLVRLEVSPAAQGQVAGATASRTRQATAPATSRRRIAGRPAKSPATVAARPSTAPRREHSGTAAERTRAASAQRSASARSWGTALVIAVAPLHGTRGRLPGGVARQLAATAGAVRGILARRGRGGAFVAVLRGQPADVRAARREHVTLGEYLLARDLAARGVTLSPRAFASRPLAAVLRRAGVPPAAVVAALRAAGTGPAAPSPPPAAPPGISFPPGRGPAARGVGPAPRQETPPRHASALVPSTPPPVRQESHGAAAGGRHPVRPSGRARVRPGAARRGAPWTGPPRPSRGAGEGATPPQARGRPGLPQARLQRGAGGTVSRGQPEAVAQPGAGLRVRQSPPRPLPATAAPGRARLAVPRGPRLGAGRSLPAAPGQTPEVGGLPRGAGRSRPGGGLTQRPAGEPGRGRAGMPRVAGAALGPAGRGLGAASSAPRSGHGPSPKRPRHWPGVVLPPWLQAAGTQPVLRQGRPAPGAHQPRGSTAPGGAADGARQRPTAPGGRGGGAPGAPGGAGTPAAAVGPRAAPRGRGAPPPGAGVSATRSRRGLVRRRAAR
jgi:hypothetical protein